MSKPLFPPEIIENSVECYHARISTSSKAIYGLLLGMILFKVEIIEDTLDLGNINGA